MKLVRFRAFIAFLEIEDILVERHCFSHIIHLDGDVDAVISSDTHNSSLLLCEQCLASFRTTSASLGADAAMLYFPGVAFAHRAADFTSLDAGSQLRAG